MNWISLVQLKSKLLWEKSTFIEVVPNQLPQGYEIPPLFEIQLLDEKQPLKKARKLDILEEAMGSVFDFGDLNFEELPENEIPYEAQIQPEFQLEPGNPFQPETTNQIEGVNICPKHKNLSHDQSKLFPKKFYKTK